MSDDQQLDFNAVLFPGRKMLYVSEVAERLMVTERHIRDLIDEGQLGAVNVGGGELKHWRVPVGEFEKFLKSRSSLSATQGAPVNPFSMEHAEHDRAIGMPD